MLHFDTSELFAFCRKLKYTVAYLSKIKHIDAHYDILLKLNILLHTVGLFPRNRQGAVWAKINAGKKTFCR